MIYDEFPSEGKIVDVDGNFANVRSGSSSTIFRHCPVVGDAKVLVPGQTVGLRWVDSRPYVLATTQLSNAITQQTYNPDGVTLENSPYGIRVKPGSIQLSHLGFAPSLEGHTHKDSFQRAGWNVDGDGVIHKDNVNIHPNGQISLGLSPNVIKLDAVHATHRFWAGNVDPALAPFSIEKDGKINATAGSIAGWDILVDRLSKNGAELKAAGELVLGAGNDVAVLSAIDPNDFRLWIGNADPSLAPFRVSKTGEVWLQNAHINATLESANYISGQAGWHIDSSGWAELQDVTIRGSIEAVTFKNSVTSVLSGRQIVADGAVFVSDVGTTDTTIDVDANVFQADDILQSQPAPDKKEWMKIIGEPLVIAGGFRYEVERDLAGEGAVQFYAGENIFRKGAATYPSPAPTIGSYEMGFGYADAFIGGAPYSSLGGFLTFEASREWGPFIAVARRHGAAYNQITDVMRMGRLRFASFIDEYEKARPGKIQAWLLTIV